MDIVRSLKLESFILTKLTKHTVPVNLVGPQVSLPHQRPSCLVLLPPVAGCDAAEASPPPTTPTAGQAIPLLTHTPCYSAATAASHRSEPVNPRTPLRVGIHCHVFPGSASSPS